MRHNCIPTQQLIAVQGIASEYRHNAAHANTTKRNRNEKSGPQPAEPCGSEIDINRSGLLAKLPFGTSQNEWSHALEIIELDTL